MTLPITISNKELARFTAVNWPATHVITALDPGDRLWTPSNIKPANHLQINFADEEHPKLAFAPTRDHVSRILSWSAGLNPDKDRLLVHCQAGISRSTAIASAIWIQHNGRDWEGLFSWLMAGRAAASPNILIAIFADDHLGLQGNLIEMMADIRETNFRHKFGFGSDKVTSIDNLRRDIARSEEQQKRMRLV